MPRILVIRILIRRLRVGVALVRLTVPLLRLPLWLSVAWVLHGPRSATILRLPCLLSLFLVKDDHNNADNDQDGDGNNDPDPGRYAVGALTRRGQPRTGEQIVRIGPGNGVPIDLARSRMAEDLTREGHRHLKVAEHTRVRGAVGAPAIAEQVRGHLERHLVFVEGDLHAIIFVEISSGGLPGNDAPDVIIVLELLDRAVRAGTGGPLRVVAVGKLRGEGASRRTGY